MGQSLTRPLPPRRSPSLADRLISSAAVLLRRRPSTSSTPGLPPASLSLSLSLTTPSTSRDHIASLPDASHGDAATASRVMAEAEVDRINQLHYGFSALTDGRLFLAPVDLSHAPLRSSSSGKNTPVDAMLRVMDFGCGPGTWLMEMASAFPRATFLGVDQSAIFPTTVLPANCHFRATSILSPHGIADATANNTFHFIHMRFILATLPSIAWDPLLGELTRNRLVPGGLGWIELTESTGMIHGAGGPMTAVIQDWMRRLYVEDMGICGDANAELLGGIESILTRHGLVDVASMRILVPLNMETDVNMADTSIPASTTIVARSKLAATSVAENLKWLYTLTARIAAERGWVSDMAAAEAAVERWWDEERLTPDAGWVEVLCTWGRTP